MYQVRRRAVYNSVTFFVFNGAVSFFVSRLIC
jgi:hypothetical protein